DDRTPDRSRYPLRGFADHRQRNRRTAGAGVARGPAGSRRPRRRCDSSGDAPVSGEETSADAFEAFGRDMRDVFTGLQRVIAAAAVPGLPEYLRADLAAKAADMVDALATNDAQLINLATGLSRKVDALL